MTKSKKLALLYIMDILQKQTDADHPLQQKTIAEILRSEDDGYGIDLDYKTMINHIRLLTDEGLIESAGKKRGCYFDDRVLEDSELRLLIHSVICSEFVSPRQTEDLVKRLCTLSNRFFLPATDYLQMADSWKKTSNQEIFLNIETLEAAIRKQRKVTYSYYKYGVDLKQHESSAHTVSPYAVFIKNQKYYLMAYSEDVGGVVYHRLDRMKKISELRKARKQLETIPGYENGIDYRFLSSSLPYMYSDEPVKIKFRADEEILDHIIDWFGKDTIQIQQSKKTTGAIVVDLESSPTAFEYWAKQYLDYVEVLAPKELRERVYTSLYEGLKKYSKKKSKQTKA